MTTSFKLSLPLLRLATCAVLCSCSVVASAATHSLRYQDNGDGTVTDHQLHLVWQRCNVGQVWLQGACHGNAARFNWRAALQLETDGWRLPSIEELNSLVVCQDRQQGQKSTQKCTEHHDGPTIDRRHFPETPEYMHWSATGYKGNYTLAWGLHFDDGHVYAGGIDYRFYVRLVRQAPVKVPAR